VQQRQQQLSMEISDADAEGIYSNMAMIVHSPQEFIIDFARITPNARKTKIYARIIMTPAHARMLHKGLEDNIKKYESVHGEIKMPGKDEKNIGFQQPREQQ
jgi:hypothetical protein